jgi:cysteine desulfurase/selenocysteine lyase
MGEFDVQKIREDFPILATRVWGRPLVYLDNAATAQKPRAVLEAMDDIYTRWNGNIHRGIHFLSEESTAAYEAARETVREYIGADSREEVIFTSGATASLNIAARSLCELLVAPGDNIIVSEMEHHSDIVPWQVATATADYAGKSSSRGVEIRVLPFNDSGELEIERLESLIDDRTRIVAVTQGSNVLGTRPDIAAITKIAHRHGVVVVVDG